MCRVFVMSYRFRCNIGPPGSLSAKMAYQTPVFVHKKDHGHIGRGKGLNASLTSPVVQNNENSFILHKGAQRVKTGALQERKALRDLTNETRRKPCALSDKSAPHSNHGTGKKKKTVAADVEIQEWAAESIEKKKIEEWADEGIETMHYFDVQKFCTDRTMDWCYSGLFLGGVDIEQSPPSQSFYDDEDVLKMEHSPEMVLPPSRCPISNAISPFILGDDERFHLYFNKDHDWSLPRLKEEYELVED